MSRGRANKPMHPTNNRFAADLAADWKQHGPAMLGRVRSWMPTAYLKLVAGHCPEAMTEAAKLAAMSDEEIRERLDATLLEMADAGWKFPTATDRI